MMQNHQPETEGDWNERRLRALQGGPYSSLHTSIYILPLSTR